MIKNDHWYSLVIKNDHWYSLGSTRQHREAGAVFVPVRVSEVSEIKNIENVVDYCLFNFDSFKYLTDLGCIVNTNKDFSYRGAPERIKNYVQVIKVNRPFSYNIVFYFNIPENKVDLLIKQTRKHLLLSSFENKE
jgi:hypothetical protein